MALMRPRKTTLSAIGIASAHHDQNSASACALGQNFVSDFERDTHPYARHDAARPISAVAVDFSTVIGRYPPVTAFPACERAHDHATILTFAARGPRGSGVISNSISRPLRINRRVSSGMSLRWMNTLGAEPETGST